MGRRKISAVIACYRDAPAIPIMHERLVASSQSSTSITKSSSSTTPVLTMPRRCSPTSQRGMRHVTAVTHSRNFGSQSAFTSGMRICSGDAVVLLDGDLQDPPELIEAFYEKWLEGYDVVYGSRVKRDANRFLQVSYRAFYRLFRAASYVPVPLDAGDFSLMDRRVVDALNRLPETNRFLRGLRAWVGFRQIGVPYHRPERMFGTTTNSLLRNIGWARKAIFSFSYIPLELITIVGVLTTVAAFVAILITIIVRIVNPVAAPTGFTSLIVLILFIGGIQLLCLSVIGSYLAHIYEEVKRRPPYIVAEIVNRPVARPDRVTGERPATEEDDSSAVL